MNKSIALRGVAAALFMTWAGSVGAFTMQETSGLQEGLPPIAERAPVEPMITEMESIGRTTGKQGGEMHTLVGRTKDARLINVWGYARLMGYDEELSLQADILKSVENEDDRIFTLKLREGHKWSDGHPFTSEDFRFWFEDILNNEDLNPWGMPPFMMAGGEAPTFEVIDETTVRFTWNSPNPLFLPELAKSRPPFIYRPAHYLKQFHEAYGDPAEIAKMAAQFKVRSWAPLFNKLDDMYNGRNVDLPSLQPWVRVDEGDDRRIVFSRNPYFHRFDSTGQQLPYIDRVVMTVADGKLIPAKTQAGESHLQARNLNFSDISVLKRGEKGEGYKTQLWLSTKGSEVSLLPNLAVKDPVWRKLNQDVRFRRALSLGIDRSMINKVLYFGLAHPGNDTVLSMSPLFREEYATKWAEFDPDKANALLDEIGLVERREDGVRLLPDGRPLEIIIESTGESRAQDDAIELVSETWRELGIRAFLKPSQRDTIRNRAISGDLVMSVWSGFENGVPTAEMPPLDYAPTRGDFLSWATWGDYYETEGKSGEKPDWAPAIRLNELYEAWLSSSSNEERSNIWHEMLQIHADETIHIGLVNEVRQPVVVKGLSNVPEKAIYGWDPGSHFGIHRMDAFYFTDLK